MIVFAAIQKEGTVYVGGPKDRHDSVILAQPLGFFNRDNSVQGFVTDTGEFLDRKQAATHAFLCGQMSEDVGCLMSEDLW